MSDQKPNLLLEAVLALTKPVRRKVIQPDAKSPSGTRVVTVQLPSLLDQMRAAITGSIGGSTRGASDPSARNILDTDALYRLMLINSQIMSWARMVSAEVVKNDTGKTLGNWYQKYTYRPTTLESERFYIRKLNTWAGQIETKLDPFNEMDLPDACPVCGAETWRSPATHEEYLRPLVIEYKPTGPNMIQEARALCRACTHVWGVRELAFELEQHVADE